MHCCDSTNALIICMILHFPWRRGRFQLKKLGGLYLDYASIAYYVSCQSTVAVDTANTPLVERWRVERRCIRTVGTEDGVTLLAGVVLIYLAGGVSGAGVFRNDVWWVFICLFLTVASWLWAPFIFNPYQLLQLQQMHQHQSYISYINHI